MDGNRFTPRAYEEGAVSIEALEEEVEAIYRKGGLKDLRGSPRVGRNIAGSASTKRQ